MSEFKNFFSQNNENIKPKNILFIKKTKTKINQLLNFENIHFKIFIGNDLLNFKIINTEKFVYLDENILANNINLTLFNGKNLIGILSLNKDNKNNISLDFIDINSDYQNKGLSKFLIEKMFEYLIDNDYTKLKITPYSELGKKYLQKNIESFANIFPNIKIKNRSYIIHSSII